MIKKIVSFGVFMFLMYGLAACETTGTGAGAC